MANLAGDGTLSNEWRRIHSNVGLDKQRQPKADETRWWTRQQRQQTTENVQNAEKVQIMMSVPQKTNEWTLFPTTGAKTSTIHW